MNEKTINYLNLKNLKSIQRGSIIINVSRAQLIEKNALIKFLMNGKLGALGIDAHYFEPTKKNDKLLSLPNVICTPHTAGSTKDTYERVIDVCINNIKSMLFNNKCKYRVI